MIDAIIARLLESALLTAAAALLACQLLACPLIWLVLRREITRRDDGRADIPAGPRRLRQRKVAAKQRRAARPGGRRRPTG